MAYFVTVPQAAQLILNGDIVAVPTETVYGLAANGTNDLAVAKIYALKNRPVFNPLILHIATTEQAHQIAHMNTMALILANAFWPGPLTMVLPAQHNNNISKLACAGLSTIALRMPSHPVMHELLNCLKLPLASPSANPSEHISPTQSMHVIHNFGNQLPVIEGGPCAAGVESTIIDLTSNLPVILRHGPITQSQIENLIGPISHHITGEIKAPGQLLRHYAPNKPLRINASFVHNNEGLVAFGAPLQGAQMTINLSLSQNLQEAAANLFNALHLMDQSSVESIAVMPVPHQGIGAAINDRLKRAASSLATF